MAPNPALLQAPLLPGSVATRIDVLHLGRELEAIETFLVQARLRQSGTAVTMPRLSKLLEELAAGNGVNLLQADGRASLAKFLAELSAHAPVLHFSFAAEPNAAFTQKLITWLRREIHPLVLIDIGLQPNIAAGCMLRTTNKYFDFSLRQHLIKHKSELVTLLGGKT